MIHSFVRAKSCRQRLQVPRLPASGVQLCAIHSIHSTLAWTSNASCFMAMCLLWMGQNGKLGREIVLWMIEKLRLYL